MAQIDFKPIAIAGVPNVISQAAFEGAPWLGPGRQPGILPSADFNKIVRQSSVMVAALATYISNNTGGADVLDNGDLAALVAQLQNAISVASAIKPVRLVTSSAALGIALTDYRIGLNRVAGLAAMAINLPAVTDANIGQEFVVSDLKGNLGAFPATVAPVVGTISGLANFVMNQDKQRALFVYYGTNIWGVET